MDGVVNFIVSLLTIVLGFICLLILVPILGFVVFKIVQRIVFNKAISKSKLENDNIFLKIKIPPSNEQKEEAMVAFLKSMHRQLPSGANISLEMVSANQFLTYYFVLPSEFKNVAESQIYAQFPDAEVEVLPADSTQLQLLLQVLVL